MLTYEEKFNGGNPWILVYKNGKQVGIIKAMAGGYIFHAHGDDGPQTYVIRRTVEEVKQNLKED